MSVSFREIRGLHRDVLHGPHHRFLDLRFREREFTVVAELIADAHVIAYRETKHRPRVLALAARYAVPRKAALRVDGRHVRNTLARLRSPKPEQSMFPPHRLAGALARKAQQCQVHFLEMVRSERLQLLSDRLILLVFSGFPRGDVSQSVSQTVSQNSSRSRTQNP